MKFLNKPVSVNTKLIEKLGPEVPDPSSYISAKEMMPGQDPNAVAESVDAVEDAKETQEAAEAVSMTKVSKAKYKSAANAGQERQTFAKTLVPKTADQTAELDEELEKQDQEEAVQEGELDQAHAENGATIRGGVDTLMAQVTPPEPSAASEEGAAANGALTQAGPDKAGDKA